MQETQKQKEIDDRPEIPEEQIIEVNNSKKIDFSKPYKFIYFEWWFHLLTLPFYAFCYILVWLCGRFFGLKVKKSKEVRKLLRKQGCLIVSNHCHFFDTVFANMIFSPQRIYVSVVQRNFEVPGVRILLRMLRAFPIPSSSIGFKMITPPVGEALRRGHHVLFLPEGNLVHLSQTIYRFKPGAFHQAYIHQTPIVPIVYIQKRRHFFGKEMPKNWIKMICVFGRAYYPPAKKEEETLPREELKEMSNSVAKWMEDTIAEAHGL